MRPRSHERVATPAAPSTTDESVDLDLGHDEHVRQAREDLTDVGLDHLGDVVAEEVVLRAALGHHVEPVTGDLVDRAAKAPHLVDGQPTAVVFERAARGDGHAALRRPTHDGDAAGGAGDDDGLGRGVHVIPASCSFERGVTDGLRPRRVNSLGIYILYYIMINKASTLTNIHISVDCKMIRSTLMGKCSKVRDRHTFTTAHNIINAK